MLTAAPAALRRQLRAALSFAPKCLDTLTAFFRGAISQARTVLGNTLLLGGTGSALEKGAHAEASTVLGVTLHLGDTGRALE